MNDFPVIKFNSVMVTRRQVAAAAMTYLGVAYSPSVSYFTKDGAGNAQGYTTCYGLFFQTAIDVGLLPGDFDINLPPAKFGGMKPAHSIVQIVHENFTLIDTADMDAGDLIMLRHRDVNPHLTEPHHVALCVKKQGDDGLFSMPAMIHAVEHRKGTGRVIVQPMDALTMSRVDSVWKINNLRG